MKSIRAVIGHMDDMLDIETLKQECDAGRIKWTVHILEKMLERNIGPTDVINCIRTGRIIEQYPQAYPYPACLILGLTTNKDKCIHVVVGHGMGYLWIVTVYEPDENEWTNECSERKV